MNLKYRKTIIAGNWKMHLNAEEAKKFILQLKSKASQAKWCDVVLCVPFLQIPAAVRAAKHTKVAIGAQNCHFEESGAYTGEISCKMLAEAGVKYVIIGHSERRQLFGETDIIVNKKVHAALEAGLNPIICVGESLEEREMGITLDRITLQVKAALAGVSGDKIRKCVIAYEPIWAIGTGRTATSEQAAEVCNEIRAVIRNMHGARTARSVTIQYGGSMNPANAEELLAQQDIDGGLIGGVALDPAKFVSIISAANQE